MFWLPGKLPECISFKLAVLTYRSIHGTSPNCLQPCFTVLPKWQQDDGCGLLPDIVPPVRLWTVGKRAFLVASANMWNDLLFHITSAVTRGLQTASHDFSFLSFLPGNPDMTYLSLLIIIIVFFFFFSGISHRPCNNWHHLGHKTCRWWWWWWWSRFCVTLQSPPVGGVNLSPCRCLAL